MDNKFNLIGAVIVAALVLLCLSFMSCGTDSNQDNNVVVKSDTTIVPLRQVVSKHQVIETERFSSFFFISSGEYQSKEMTFINMYGLVEDVYHLLSLNNERLAIKIDTTITDPYLIIIDNKFTIEQILNKAKKGRYYSTTQFQLVCPEEHFPVTILPIQL